MTIQRAIDNIQGRITVIESLSPEQQDDFARGQALAYRWALEEVTRAIAAILPHESVSSDEERETEERETEAFLARFNDEDLFIPLISPSRHGGACLNRPGAEHAYVPNTPTKKFKRCSFCGDTQPMNHGEKIRVTRTAPKPSRAETAWAE